jgi:hypothetical protein
MRPEPFRFTLMTVPHADHSAGRSSRRPYTHDKSRIQLTSRNVAGFAEIEPVVNPGQVEPGKNVAGAAHVQSPLAQRLWPLCRIAGYAQ